MAVNPATRRIHDVDEGPRDMRAPLGATGSGVAGMTRSCSPHRVPAARLAAAGAALSDPETEESPS